MRGAWLADLTWQEAEARFRAGAIVVVPVGAGAKAHGAHLPLDTDRVLARALSEAVARELPVVIAPLVEFGWYPAFAGYPGSQTIRADTFVRLVSELLVKFAADGARHLAVINAGVSTEGPLGIAARGVLEQTGLRVAIADIRNLGRAADAVIERRDGGHADEHETSLMLAIDPGRVRMDRARGEPPPPAPTTVFRRPALLQGDAPGRDDYSRDGATGDPTLATAAKGEAILAAMTRDLVDGLRATFPEADGA